MAKRSAGLLMYRERGGKVEVLLVHPGAGQEKNPQRTNPVIERAQTNLCRKDTPCLMLAGAGKTRREVINTQLD
jgi:predicted NUDIX family NTP pyrophosphohydrolase